MRRQYRESCLKEFWCMSCKSLLYMVGMFVFVPVWIGLLWTDFLKIRECASQLLHAWVLGFATMLATAQLMRSLAIRLVS